MEIDIKPKFVSEHLQDGKNIEGGLCINLYKNPPYGQLTLEECEDLFRQRLEAYSIIEKADTSDKNLPVLANSLREIKSYVYKTNCILLRANDKQQYRLDHFSHMLTRMYCVYQPSLWLWFKMCERKLFNYRLRDQALSLSGNQLETILKSYNFDFERVVGSEFNELFRENLIGWSKQERGDIFKVKFVNALKFIARRSVSLKNGFAYLTKFEIISVVCDVFEKHLESELYFARQHLNLELLQTQQLLESLSLVYHDFQERVAEERKTMKNQDGENSFPYRIDIENLDELVRDHYPPCMRHIHEVLVQDHHLKHQARLHYGAFLRSGGVEMDAAIEFWRKEFTKKIPNDKFERDYKYNIRHLYGKEGHKKALSCFSCDKIINDNPPGPSEKHGCPFKHFDEAHLRTMLTKHKLKEVDIESIILHRNDGEYKLACSHYFKFLKGDFPTEPIKNPIHFYFESKRLANRPQEEQAEQEESKADQIEPKPNEAKHDVDMEEWDD